MARYEDKRLIGTGGFGEVWICERDSDGKSFAKKTLQKEPEPDAIVRFQREIRILASLDHPNVVAIIAKRLHRPPYFYVMPLYERSLAQDLTDLYQDDDQIWRVLSPILDGVEYAHDQGVIHRDLKPENVLLRGDNEVVVSDFGLGRVIDAASTRQTQTGDRMGTPLYMAPEQLLNAKAADERADVFSLGRMVYELYTGPLGSAVQELSLIPAGLRHIVEKCTKSNPQDRYESVTLLKRSLQRYYEARGVIANRSGLEELQDRLDEPGEYGSSDLQRFLDLICENEDDSDGLHEILIEIDPSLFESLCEHDIVRLRSLIEEFSQFTATQGWGFTYTDRIANQCLRLFRATDDAVIRACLVECVLHVGYSHNRWHVLKVFGQMLAMLRREDEIVLAAEKLDSVPADVRSGAVPYINLRAIHSALRPLFAE